MRHNTLSRISLSLKRLETGGFMRFLIRSKNLDSDKKHSNMMV